MKRRHWDVEYVYRQGVGARNEDAYVVDDRKALYAAIDGATGLGKGQGASGAIAAGVIRDTLNDWDGEGTLLGRILEANERLGELNGNRSGVGQAPKEEFSTAGFAIVQLETDEQGAAVRMQYVHSGDCMLFVQYDDGQVRTLTHDHISRLDQVAISRFSALWESYKGDFINPGEMEPELLARTMKEMKHTLQPLLLDNRRKLNTPGGYGILDGSPEAERYLESGCIRVDRASRILLLTDGLQLPTFKASDTDGWLEAARYAFVHGAAALERKVLELEAEDPACYLYPRLKPADDKTGVLLTIK